MIEIEAKFLVRDIDHLRMKIRNAGGALVHDRFLMQRKVFDFPGFTLDAKAAWLRVRAEPNRIVATYKHRVTESLTGMHEVEVGVDNFENACSLFQALGMIEKAHQASYREKWILAGCEVAIDEWPWIPPVVEIEGSTEREVQAAATLLGLPWADAIFDSIDAVYQRYFDVTRTEISSIPLAFTEMPELLRKRRRTSQSAQ